MGNAIGQQKGDDVFDLRFDNKCDSPVQIAVRSKNQRTSEWKSDAWFQLESNSGPTTLNDVITDNRFIAYFAEATDGSGKVWEGTNEENSATFDTVPAPDIRTVNGRTVDLGEYIGIYTMNLICPDQMTELSIKQIPEYTYLQSDIYGIRWNPVLMKLGVRVGATPIAGVIARRPEERPVYTNYNRVRLTGWKLEEIDAERGIHISVRWDVEKLEDNPLKIFTGGGRSTVCTASGRLSFYNRFIKDDSGGIAVKINPGRYSQDNSCLLVRIASLNNMLVEDAVNALIGIYNFADMVGGLEPKKQLVFPIESISNLIQSERITFDSATYDSDGVWLDFNINRAKLITGDQAVSTTVEAFCKAAGRCTGSQDIGQGGIGFTTPVSSRGLSNIATVTTNRTLSGNNFMKGSTRREKVLSKGFMTVTSNNRALSGVINDKGLSTKPNNYSNKKNQNKNALSNTGTGMPRPSNVTTTANENQLDGLTPSEAKKRCMKDYQTQPKLLKKCFSIVNEYFNANEETLENRYERKATTRLPEDTKGELSGMTIDDARIRCVTDYESRPKLLKRCMDKVAMFYSSLTDVPGRTSISSEDKDTDDATPESRLQDELQGLTEKQAKKRCQKDYATQPKLLKKCLSRVEQYFQDSAE